MVNVNNLSRKRANSAHPSRLTLLSKPILDDRVRRAEMRRRTDFCLYTACSLPGQSIDKMHRIYHGFTVLA